MDRLEFETKYRKLVSSLDKSADKSALNFGCHACERCTRCTDSTFCTDSRSLVRSHYCASCTDCTECSHSRGCSGCIACSQCVDCSRCISSAYLEQCVACTKCNYCFGCVGLTRRDFHILNEPYDRATYFEIVRKLKASLLTNA